MTSNTLQPANVPIEHVLDWFASEGYGSEVKSSNPVVLSAQIRSSYLHRFSIACQHQGTARREMGANTTGEKLWFWSAQSLMHTSTAHNKMGYDNVESAYQIGQLLMHTHQYWRINKDQLVKDTQALHLAGLAGHKDFSLWFSTQWMSAFTLHKVLMHCGRVHPMGVSKGPLIGFLNHEVMGKGFKKVLMDLHACSMEHVEHVANCAPDYGFSPSIASTQWVAFKLWSPLVEAASLVNSLHLPMQLPSALDITQRTEFKILSARAPAIIDAIALWDRVSHLPIEKIAIDTNPNEFMAQVCKEVEPSLMTEGSTSAQFEHQTHYIIDRLSNVSVQQKYSAHFWSQNVANLLDQYIASKGRLEANWAPQLHIPTSEALCAKNSMGVQGVSSELIPPHAGKKRI